MGGGEKVGPGLNCDVRSRPPIEILQCDEIIDALGGTAYLARVLFIQQSAVTAWRHNGIPAGRCLALAEIAARKKLPHFSVEVLMRSQPRSAFDPLPGSKPKVRRARGGTETS